MREFSKVRYFKDDFLGAILGSNPSMTWIKIVWGRDLFAKVTNGRWVMGLVWKSSRTFGYLGVGGLSRLDFLLGL